MSRRSPVRMMCEVPGKPGQKSEWVQIFDLPRRNMARCRWVCDRPVQVAQFRNRRDRDEYAVLHPSTKPGQGAWQLSLFDHEGAVGDVQGPSCDGVLKNAFGGRFPLHEARDWRLEHLVSDGRQLMGRRRRRRR